jgi:hypothetical protein
MPLILTPQYAVAIVAAIAITLLAKRAGLYRGLLWVLATAVIILTLWVLGFHPLGFAVSWGGWIMFLLTLLIGRLIQRAVTAIR